MPQAIHAFKNAWIACDNELYKIRLILWVMKFPGEWRHPFCFVLLFFFTWNFSNRRANVT